MSIEGRQKVCLVVTSLLIVKFFLIPHIVALSKKYEVTLIVNVDDIVFLNSLALPIKVLSVPIERKVSIWWDMVALCQLILLFRKHRFDLVHSISPKGGLLGMLAAWLVRVPVRVHTFQGEVWANRFGIWRISLKLIDKLVAYLATQITVVSFSERSFLIAEKIITENKSVVLANGSICGVDPERFHSDSNVRDALRLELCISDDAKVILFLGRINRDKGIFDLAQSFVALASETAELVLLVVGPDEEGIFEEVLHICRNYLNRVKRVGFINQPERYMAVADVLCLPSYREGFGLVIVEAGAVGIPSVCSDIYGITDAVVDGMTGLLFPVGDVSALTEKLLIVIRDNNLRQRMGAAASERALALFSSGQVVNEMLKYYDRILPVRNSH